MTELLTAAQMRAIEQAAIESGAVSGLELMERAGQGVVEAIFEKWPKLGAGAHRVTVLCGPGNNGGDGFVVARMLAVHGWEAEVFLFGDADKLPPDAWTNYERWRDLGSIQPIDALPEEIEADLLVDALFGTGLFRPVTGLLAGIINRLNVQAERKSALRIVAVDLPSGLCSDSGRVLGVAVQADFAVSFHSLKIGHMVASGPEHCRSLIAKDIGLPHGPRPDYCRAAAPARDLLGKAVLSHKYSHGHAFILSGGSGKSGAARMAARGALRIGSGLVTLGVPPAAQLEVAAHITATMMRRVEDATALRVVLQDARFNALAAGPGLGLDRARDLLPEFLRTHRPTVLDADALTAYADDPDALIKGLHPDCILTPHSGEFARFFPAIAETLNRAPTSGPAYSKVDATRAAAASAGCAVLLKGPDTVVAAPDGRCVVHSAYYDRAAPWLATAGAGDVLAGFVTGLLARGFDPLAAAETAAWLHVECARVFGPGLVAEDLPEILPQVFRDLGL